jgi:hypothetical protein
MPNNFGIQRINPSEPGQCFLHATDRVGRWWGTPQARWLLLDKVREVMDHLRPGIEMPGHAHAGQTAHHIGGFDEPLLHHGRRPGRLSHPERPISASRRIQAGE